jgi:phospholipid/cholesterol/gamma-HCH transport system ATP-binding protein
MSIFGVRPGVTASAQPYRAESDGRYAIEFHDVHKAFGGSQVLTGVTMAIPKDRITMIMGPSGTGKSVCVSHMVGLTRPDSGDVLVEGISIPDLCGKDLFKLRKEKFGVLFQDGALFSSMSVFDNVAFPLRQNTDKSEAEIQEIAHRRLAEVGLAGAANIRPNELSGGMRKRVGFARALVMDPSIVLFDEPDSGLDPVRTALLCELIAEIHRDNGGTYVVVTHDMFSARRIADYICILWKGKLVDQGDAEDVFQSDDAFVRQFLAGESEGPLGMD